MNIKYKKGQMIIEISPEERDIIRIGNDEITKLTKDKKKSIESVLEKNLYCSLMGSGYHPFLYIEKNLDKLLGKEAIAILFNTLRAYGRTEELLDELIKDSLIDQNTQSYLSELSNQYGIIYNTVLSKIERPTNWSRIESNLSIVNDSINLQTKLWRIDGKLYEFDIPLRDGITLARHFIQKMLEAIDHLDINESKKEISKMNEDYMNDLEKKILTLKELYKSSKLQYEKNEENIK